MKPTLTELWHGNIRPIDVKTENDEETNELRGSLERYYNILWNKLDDDGKQILCQVKNVQTKLAASDREDAFLRGFSLAVKMITEAISE